jgi:hypothetical protein
MTLLSVQVYADDDEQNHYPDSQKHVLCFGKWIVNPHLSLFSEPELAECTGRNAVSAFPCSISTTPWSVVMDSAGTVTAEFAARVPFTIILAFLVTVFH